MRTLKEGDAFAVLDTYGDCGTVRDSPGLFFRDTRYLSRFELRLEGRRPLLLGSVIQDDNASLTVDLTNPDLGLGEDSALPRDLIAIDRTKFLWKGSLYERIGLRNYDSRSRTFRVELSFDADFRDLFEVRGMRRDRRGHRTVERTAPDEVAFRYEGLDGATRRTVLRFEPAPTRLDHHRALFDIALEPQGRCSILATVICEEEPRRDVPNFLVAYRDTPEGPRAVSREIATVESSNSLFNEVIRRFRLRHVHAGHRDGARHVPLCGHTLVQHGFRAGRHHHGDDAPVDRSVDRQRRSPPLGGDAGDRRGSRRGCAARQDLA